MSRLIPALALTVAFAGGGVAPAQAAVDAPSAWQVQEYATDGLWRIESRPDGRYLVLSKDFKTKRGPDLKLFLSPTAADRVTGKTATAGSVLIAPLTSNRGGSEYAIPADVDLDAFSSLVLHCEKFSKLWAAAPLRADGGN